MVHEVFEGLVAFAAEGARANHMARARATYERDTGKILAQDASFERRIAAFLEWYVLDWAPSDGEAAIVDYLHARDATLTANERTALQAWRASRLSLLELRRLSAGEATVDDLLTGGRHLVRPAHQLLGCDPGALVVARLLEVGAQASTLTDGVLHLPSAARKQVRAAAKALRKAGATPKEQLALLMRLAFFSDRCERYRHVDPRTLWESPPH